MKGLVTFDQFLTAALSARLKNYLGRPGTAVTDAAAFEEMKAHIVRMYQGIKVIHSFVDPAGQPFDCIPFEQQPGLRRPGMKAHRHPKPLSTPVTEPEERLASQTLGLRAVDPPLRRGRKDRFGNEMFCPAGCIPMERLTLERMTRFETLRRFFSKYPTPEPPAPAYGENTHIKGFRYVDNYGGSSFLNLWSPDVGGPEMDRFSLSQHWFTHGIRGDPNHQTVEGGWMVYPRKFGSLAVPFIYWTPDDYRTGDYNLEDGAFVQYSAEWPLGMAFDQYSTRDGEQIEYEQKWSKEIDWWLYIRLRGAWAPIGYYPVERFGEGTLASHATAAKFGGETWGAPDPIPMGSGAFAAEGAQKAAYQRKVQHLPLLGEFPVDTVLLPYDPNPECYTLDLHNRTDPPTGWRTYFYFGGPGCG